MFKLRSIFLSVIILFGAVACQKPSNESIPIPPAPTRSYTSDEIKTLMLMDGVYAPNLALPDTTYLMPTKSWIEKEFSQGLAAFQFQMGIDKWSSESNDCDKFAIAASFYCKWLNHSSPNRKYSAGIACGEIYYIRDAGGGHAINFFLTSDGDKIKTVFYEPQTRMIVALSENEKSRIFFYKL